MDVKKWGYNLKKQQNFKQLREKIGGCNKKNKKGPDFHLILFCLNGF